jgi:phosphotransacetylase
MDDFAAKSKGIVNSEVAGHADAFLAPNVEVASGVYSALSLFGSSDRGGVIVGGVVPMVAVMRTDREEEVYNSIHLGVLTALR